MSNIHSHNVSRVHRSTSYLGRAGATPEPHVPWTTRRLAWLRLIAKPEQGELGRHIEMGKQHPRTRNDQRDLARLIEEGLVAVPLKGPRTRHQKCRRKFLALSEQGLMLLAASQPEPERVAEPYAKRKAAMAEITQSNKTPKP